MGGLIEIRRQKPVDREDHRYQEGRCDVPGDIEYRYPGDHELGDDPGIAQRSRHQGRRLGENSRQSGKCDAGDRIKNCKLY